MRIQHNITALSAYRNLTNNNSAVAKNLEKLSSGYKINRAGDDAAGLAISEKMRAQITGLETAQKNANDGISLIQTAEGALTEVHSMLNRMVELATQSSNGTYQDEDRANLQAEISALRDEIDRISEGTNFNGIQLLDGSMEQKIVSSGDTNVAITAIKDGQLGKTAQAGKFSIDLSNATLTNTGAAAADIKFNIFGQEITIATSVAAGGGMTGADAAAKIAEQWNKLSTTANVGSNGRVVQGAIVGAEVSGSKVIFTMEQPPTSAWDTSAGTIAANVNITSGGTGGNQAEQLDVTVLKEPVDNTEGRKYAQGSFQLTADMIGDGKTLTIGDTTYVFAVGANSQYANKANVIDMTDVEQKDVSSKLGVAAMRLTTAAKDNANFKVGTDTKTTGATAGTISLTEKEGGVDYTKNNLVGATTTNNADATTQWLGLVKKGTMDTTASQDGLTLQIGDTADSFNQMKVSIGNMNSEALGIADIDVSTQAGAAKAVDAIKAAINKVSTQRGSLGALQNRLEHTINSLSVTTENMTAAESRIRDVDMASEMMAYTKNNILVQASQAMLAQANQIPQGVLQLLQ